MSMMRYKHSLELYKLYNGSDDRQDWIDLNFQQNFNNRNDFINVFENSRLKFGKEQNDVYKWFDKPWLDESISEFLQSEM